jgi:hypothetical protein
MTCRSLFCSAGAQLDRGGTQCAHAPLPAADTHGTGGRVREPWSEAVGPVVGRMGEVRGGCQAGGPAGPARLPEGLDDLLGQFQGAGGDEGLASVHGGGDFWEGVELAVEADRVAVEVDHGASAGVQDVVAG